MMNLGFPFLSLYTKKRQISRAVTVAIVGTLEEKRENSPIPFEANLFV